MKKITRWQMLKDLMKRMLEYQPQILLYLIIETVFQVLVPFCMIIIPTLVIGMITNQMPWADFVLWMSVVFLIYGLIRLTYTYFMNRNVFQYLNLRSSKFFIPWLWVVENLDYQYYEKDTTQLKLAESSQALFQGNYQGIEGVYHGLNNVISSFVSLIIYSLLIGRVSLWILFPIIIVSLISYAVYTYTHKQYYEKRKLLMDTDVETRYFEKLSYDTVLAKDIRLYQMKKMLNDKMNQNNHKRSDLTIRAENIMQLHAQINVLLGLIRDGVAYGYLIYLMMNGNLTVPAFVFYLGVVMGFAQHFTSFSLALAKINTDLDICKKYYDFTQDQHVVTQGQTLQADHLDIVFDHVTFKYPNSDHKVLDDFSMRFKPHEKIALVGINGAGKTTIVKLLSGLYQPTSGAIYINGINLTDINKSEYFKLIAVIFQEPILFSMTIGENISGRFEGKYDEERVIEAVEVAGLTAAIQRLPKGVHTYLNKDIDKNGINLSGGQRQRLLLAKAHYKDPLLMILDEPTAALDAVAESQLYEEYYQITHHKSALFISHRLASTRFCDRILYLENGKIIEEGSHNQLLKRAGKYAEMYQVQAQYYQKGGQDHEN